MDAVLASAMAADTPAHGKVSLRSLRGEGCFLNFGSEDVMGTFLSIELLTRVNWRSARSRNMSSQGPLCNASEEGWNEFAARRGVSARRGKVSNEKGGAKYL